MYWKKFGLSFLIAALVLEAIDYLLAVIICTSLNEACDLPLRLIEAPAIAMNITSNLTLTIFVAMAFWTVMGMLIGVIFEMILSPARKTGPKEQKLEKAIEKEIKEQIKKENEGRAIEFYKNQIQKLKVKRELVEQQGRARRLELREQKKKKKR